LAQPGITSEPLGHRVDDERNDSTSPTGHDRQSISENEANSSQPALTAPNPAGKLPPEPEPVPIIGRQQEKKRYNVGRAGIASGKRVPKRVTSVVRGGLPGLGKRK
jgi:hypothetical protein